MKKVLASSFVELVQGTTIPYKVEVKLPILFLMVEMLFSYGTYAI